MDVFLGILGASLRHGLRNEVEIRLKDVSLGESDDLVCPVFLFLNVLCRPELEPEQVFWIHRALFQRVGHQHVGEFFSQMYNQFNLGRVERFGWFWGIQNRIIAPMFDGQRQGESLEV